GKTLYGIDGDSSFGTGVTRTIPSARISASRTRLTYSFHSVIVSTFQRRSMPFISGIFALIFSFCSLSWCGGNTSLLVAKGSYYQQQNKPKLLPRPQQVREYSSRSIVHHRSIEIFLA